MPRSGDVPRSILVQMTPRPSSGLTPQSPPNRAALHEILAVPRVSVPSPSPDILVEPVPEHMDDLQFFADTAATK